jgi:FKBP-type peptidyl-prolyl cis-trans isomerase (trigger factor)
MDLKININKEPKNTFKIEVSVPKVVVEKYLDEALEHEASKLEIKGFRKGSAPANVAKDFVDQSALRSHALNHLLPEIFTRIIKENKLSPIIGPRVELRKFENDEDLELSITIVEKPDIKISDYKGKLKEAYSKKAVKNIIEVAGNAGTTKNDEANKTNDFTSQEAMQVILEASEIEIADLIVQEEVARMMTSLIDQTSQLGISIEQYAEAHKKNVQQIRDEYTKAAHDLIKADFALTEIAKTEGVSVDDTEIEKLISEIPDQKSKDALNNSEQKMYIKAVLIKNKALEKLIEIAKSKDS